ncbi:MAG: hypothetical protein EXS14_06315 [Planctomycetes bacterium]|nr:hypothetical protein [Planctomycetota bacterium]
MRNLVRATHVRRTRHSNSLHSERDFQEQFISAPFSAEKSNSFIRSPARHLLNTYRLFRFSEPFAGHGGWHGEH